MKTLVDRRLVLEAQSCALRFECDDCMHFDDGHGEGATPRCAHGYPVTEHRPGPLEGLLQAGGSLVFCKEFELGGVRRNKGMADAEPEEGA